VYSACDSPSETLNANLLVDSVYIYTDGPRFRTYLISQVNEIGSNEFKG
jgi:hypothetical protein